MLGKYKYMDNNDMKDINKMEFEDIEDKYAQVFDMLNSATNKFSIEPRRIIVLMLFDINAHDLEKLESHMKFLQMNKEYIDEWNNIFPNYSLEKMIEELKN